MSTRDCLNCGHAASRHEPIGKVLTMVCLLKACGVRPHELRETHRTPCGTALYADGVAPRRWVANGTRTAARERQIKHEE